MIKIEEMAVQRPGKVGSIGNAQTLLVGLYMLYSDFGKPALISKIENIHAL